MPIALLFSLLLAALSALPAQATGALEIEVQRNRLAEQAFFDIRASGFAHATPQHVWRMLTDYERQPGYVPNLTSARILSRSGTDVILEQEGRSGFFFFSRTIHLLVRIVERSPSSIEVTLISGDMRRYSARWLLTPAEQDGAGGTRIDYSGSIEPDFFVPPLIGNAIVQADVRKMLDAMITELEK